MSSKEANDIYTLYDHIFCGILWYFYNVASFLIKLVWGGIDLASSEKQQQQQQKPWYDCQIHMDMMTWTSYESQWAGTYSKCHKAIFCSQFLRTASVNSQEAADIITTQGPPYVAKGMILCTWAILTMLPKIRNSFHSTDKCLFWPTLYVYNQYPTFMST